MNLNARQRAFADYYLELGNATEAYVKAGYCKKGARANAARLIANDSIKAYIDGQLKQIESERIANASEVMQYLTSVLRGESEAEVVVVEGTGEGCSEAKQMTKRPDEKERLKAAELLGKRYSMFKETVNLNAPVPVVISGEDELAD